jgi:capsular exopolysaccharide synthesis family protein
MSRFYDALREASRSDSVENARLDATLQDPPKPIAKPAAASLVNGSELPSAPGRQLEALLDAMLPLPRSPQKQEAAPLASNGTGVASAASPLAEAAPERAQVTLTLDPKARLVPNAADPAVAESYRRLRTKILEQQEIKSFLTLAIASASPQEGKTITALNLAFSLALLQSCRVLLVDGDLRRGTIGKLVGADALPGLSDVIEGTAGLADVIVRCGNPPIHVLTRGQSKIAPAELLNSPDLGRHLRRLAEDFDIVLVDSPAFNMVTDARLIAAHCDAVLLIARAFSTTRKALEQAAQELSGFRVIGTVLNGGAKSQLYRRHGYYGSDR